MDLDQAKYLAEQLMRLCDDSGVAAPEVVLQSDRYDYAEALRVVMEYLP